jgi:hypothetical protein
LVSNPDSLVSMPLGSLYLTRHCFALLPRFSAYAMLRLSTFSAARSTVVGAKVSGNLAKGGSEPGQSAPQA